MTKPRTFEELLDHAIANYTIKSARAAVVDFHNQTISDTHEESYLKGQDVHDKTLIELAALQEKYEESTAKSQRLLVIARDLEDEEEEDAKLRNELEDKLAALQEKYTSLLADSIDAEQRHARLRSVVQEIVDSTTDDWDIRMLRAALEEGE